MFRPTLVRTLVAVTITVVATAVPAEAEWVDWIADGTLAWGATDNLNISAFEADERSDSVWLPAVGGGRVLQIGNRTRLSLTAELRGEIYDTFDLLDSIEVGVSASVVHKFGVGNAPWLRGFVYGAHKDVQQSERSGPRFEIGVQGGIRLSPRIDLWAAYRFTDRDGGNGPIADPAIPTNVFDQRYSLVSASANFLLASRLLLSTTYSFRAGDFDSTCAPWNIGTVLAEERVEALALDPVFGGCVYRLKGTAHAVAVDLSVGLTKHLSLDFDLGIQRGKADNLTYDASTGRVALLYSY